MIELTEYEKQSLDYLKSIHKQLREMNVRLQETLQKMSD